MGDFYKHCAPCMSHDLSCLDRDTTTSPPTSTVDPTQVADALPSPPSNMTAQALSRWEQSRESHHPSSSYDDDPCCTPPSIDVEPHTECNLIHPLPKIHEVDEKEYDHDVKQEPIVRRRLH